MKKSIFLKTIILCTTCFFIFSPMPEVGADSGVEKLLPQSPGVVGWQLVGNYYHYLPNNLYNYINGAADLFVSYGFVKLAGAEYAPRAGEQENAIIDIYDMGNKLNAFGVFQSKRDPESKSFKIGTGAFGSEKYIFFYKDRFYIEVQAYLSASKDKDIPLKLARKVAGGISGDCTPPSELNYLPEAGRVPGSEIYITGGILGHAFLDKGMMGDYRLDDEVVKAFVAFYPSGEQAVVALNRYKDFLKKAGEKWQVLDGFGERGILSREPYHKNILVSQQGPFVVGVTDLSHAQKGEELLKNIIRNIKKPS
ncbi:MAG: hypothetical protein JRF22_04905 [Deltaproteobacteria bacterium]|nr:hypothetical protein [Deltaproteobacteria bacterium]